MDEGRMKRFIENFRQTHLPFRRALKLKAWSVPPNPASEEEVRGGTGGIFQIIRSRTGALSTRSDFSARILTIARYAKLLGGASASAAFDLGADGGGDRCIEDDFRKLENGERNFRHKRSAVYRRRIWCANHGQPERCIRSRD